MGGGFGRLRLGEDMIPRRESHGSPFVALHPRVARARHPVEPARHANPATGGNAKQMCSCVCVC
jgi:hypothetical protein